VWEKSISKKLNVGYLPYSSILFRQSASEFVYKWNRPIQYVQILKTLSLPNENEINTSREKGEIIVLGEKKEEKTIRQEDRRYEIWGFSPQWVEIIIIQAEFFKSL